MMAASVADRLTGPIAEGRLTVLNRAAADVSDTRRDRSRRLSTRMHAARVAIRRPAGYGMLGNWRGGGV